MSKQEVCSELNRLLRLQRHDFINHAQIIHAYLQVGKIDKAKQYIEELCNDPERLCLALQEHKSVPECSVKE